MKKVYLIIPVCIIILAGIWYGASWMRFNRAVSSGRPLLLLNKQYKTYTYSNLLPPDDIDRSFTIAGYLDEMTPAQIEAAVQGYNLAGGDLIKAGLIQPASSQVQVPTMAQAPDWKTAVGALAVAQQELCAHMPTPDFSQYCLVQHMVYNAIKAGKDASACAPVFVEDYRKACEKAVTAKNTTVVPDKNGNSLIDLFEAASQQAAPSK